tara:strand:+ start:1025 stop:1396 length:372 start_codon:yes stop_codon:yes gene_type:complete
MTKKILVTLICFFLTSDFLFSEENKKLKIEIYKNLRCLICQGQSVADSNSEFAQTIKLVVEDQINEGKSKKEIYDFLIEKYGEWITYKPSLNRKNILLWVLPYLILLLGGVIILIMLKKRNNN